MLLISHDQSLTHAIAYVRVFPRRSIGERPYSRLEWCEAALMNPIRKEVQPEDGRIRHWIFVPELDRYLRVVTLEDGVTLHNAFPDRRFKP